MLLRRVARRLETRAPGHERHGRLAHRPRRLVGGDRGRRPARSARRGGAPGDRRLRRARADGAGDLQVGGPEVGRRSRAGDRDPDPAGPATAARGDRRGPPARRGRRARPRDRRAADHRRRLGAVGARAGWGLVGWGRLMGSAILGVYQALSRGEVSLVTPINATQPLIVLLFSTLLLRDLERIRPITVVSATEIVAGAGLGARGG